VDTRHAAARFLFWAALTTAALTVVTFGFAITPIPDSGRNCQENCASYPFASDHVASSLVATSEAEENDEQGNKSSSNSPGRLCRGAGDHPRHI
jgi:hypothetical protein